MSAPASTSHTRFDPLMTGRVRVMRSGGGLGESRTDDGLAIRDLDLRPVGEERGDVPVGPDAEEADVEDGHGSSSEAKRASSAA